MRLIPKLRSDYPTIHFTPGDRASWSPKSRQVFYTDSEDEREMWAVLHELGHALLNHTTYETDVSLLKKEVQAWAKAAQLADHYDITIDPDHIENSLDTYRDWLHARSLCPTCHAQGLQSSSNRYSCPNCKSAWQVTSERFCRVYRRSGSN